MTRKELSEALAVARDMPLRKAEEVVAGVFFAMSEALVEEGRIEVRGFGSFITKDRAGYKGINPKTGEITDVRDKKSILFKAGREMKCRLSPHLPKPK